MQLQSLQSQHAHYRDVRARINAPREIRTKPKPRAFQVSDAARYVLTGQPAYRDIGFQQDDHIRARRKWLKYRADLRSFSPILSIAEIVHTVAVDFGIEVGDVVSTGRLGNVVIARHLSVYLTRRLTKASLPMIARYLNRDHSTLVHSIRSIEQKIAADPALQGRARRLEIFLTDEADASFGAA